MGYSFSARSRARMRGVDDRLIQIAQRALELSKVDFGISICVRFAISVQESLLISRSQSTIGRYAKIHFGQL